MDDCIVSGAYGRRDLIFGPVSLQQSYRGAQFNESASRNLSLRLQVLAALNKTDRDNSTCAQSFIAEINNTGLQPGPVPVAAA
jgi:hypothetical protein